MRNPGRAEVLGEHAANPAQSAVGFGGVGVATGWCPRCRAIKHVRLVGTQCDGCPDPIQAKEWPCSAMEDRLIAQFEEEVRRRARNAYQSLMGTDPAEAEAMRSQYMDDFAAEAYNWDDQGANHINHVTVARKKTWGALFILFLIMRRCDATVTQEQAKQAWLANPGDAMAAYLWAQGLAPIPKKPQPQPQQGAEAGATSLPTFDEIQTPPTGP